MSDPHSDRTAPDPSPDIAAAEDGATANVQVLFQSPETFKPGDHQALAVNLATPPDQQRSSQSSYARLYAAQGEVMQAYLAAGVQQLGNWWSVAFPGMEKVISAQIASVTMDPARRNRMLDRYPAMADSFNSPHMARVFQWGDHQAPSHASKTYNNGLYTHNADGSLNHVRSSDIQPYFAKGTNPKNWPQLVLTSSHARCDVSRDISDIMENVHAMLSHLRGKKIRSGAYEMLPLIRDPWHTKPGRGKTIVLSAVHTQPTFDGNAAAMLMRFNFRKDHRSLNERVNPQLSALYRNATEKEAALLAPSPAAERLSKLMLKLMVEQPDAIDVDSTQTLAQLQHSHQLAALPELRSDAPEIAKHISLIGYSLAANTVNDALRHFAHELRYIYLQQGKSDIEARHATAKIIQNIPLVCLNGPAVPMTQEEYDLGIRRVIVNSRNDLVSYHFLISGWGSKQALEAPAKYGTKCIVDGTSHNNGHGNDEAMGKGQKLGYFLQDARARQALQDLFTRRFSGKSI